LSAMPSLGKRISSVQLRVRAPISLSKEMHETTNL